MNFFHSWGKAKISSVNNKDRDKITVESNAPVGNETTMLENPSNSRTYYKRKNRKKNFLFTRSLWYDVEREEKFESKIKKSKSVDNLDSFDGDYFSENLQKEDTQPHFNVYEEEKTSFNVLKKSFSLENLAKKISDKGKTKPFLSKDMISNPTHFRKIVDTKEFPSFVPFRKILEENDDDAIEGGKEIPKSIDKEFEQEVNTLFPVKKDLRRSLSTGNLVANKVLNNRRRSSCPNKLLQTTIICEDPLNTLRYAIATSTINKENSPVCIIKEEPTIPLKIENDTGSNKNKENSFELISDTEIDNGSSELKEDTLISDILLQPIDEVFCDSVDGGTLRKPAKKSLENDFLSRNRELLILRKNEVLFIKNQTSEVLKTLQLSRDDSNAQYYPPQKFPLPDDTEGIQYRKNPIASYRISKTTDFDFPRKPFGSDDSCHDFEARGCSRIQLPNDGMRKLKKIEFIKYKNGIIYRCTENGDVPLSYSTVRLRTARMLNKREVEFRDEHNKIFILIFDSSKDAKLFIESDKLSPYIADDHKSSVKKTLFRLLGKRSSREVLEKKGIYQNEPIFGNTLKNIYNIERGVPQFILKTIELIEKPENIVSLGIYRTSGNLATIQKIRFEVDKGRLEILDDFSKDVDVLTGSLKLFFRELKEPLISCEACDQLLNLTKPDMSYTKKDKDKIKSVLNHLPEANWDTLRVLLKHLIEVAKYKDQNKMDTYNLSVCWGPTVIFATESLDCANYKDIVTQSTEATRMFESLLLFYINNPEELETGKRKQDSLDRNRNLVFRQDSKESIKSSDSNTSKGTAKRSASNLSLDIDDVVVKKMVELIESNLNVDGLYRRPGAADKISKISKKLSKKKLTDLDKYKNDVHELCSSLRAYLQSQEPLVTRQVVEQVIKICDKTPCLEQNTRQKIMLALQDLPKRDTFTFLIKHIILVLDNEPQQVPRSEIITVWVNIFNQKHLMESDEKFFNFLNIILEVYDEKKPDIIGLHLGMNNGLLNDLRNLQKERDRTSKYDNVPDDVDIRHEATFLDEKTDHLEHTKL